MAISAEEFHLLKQAADLGLLSDLNRARFSLTGRLSMPRVDMVKLIRACNGLWDERPQHGTRFLIVGDTANHGFTLKMREAQQRGTRVIYENEFVEMIAPKA